MSARFQRRIRADRAARGSEGTRRRLAPGSPRVRTLFALRQSDNLDRARGVTRNGVGYAPEEESIQPLPAVRPDHDQVRAPLRRFVEDFGLRITLEDIAAGAKSRLPQCLDRAVYDAPGLFPPFAFDFRDVWNAVGD